jgi:hypothetical protein
MPTKLPVALFNYQGGGRRPDGSYDFDKLRLAFDNVPDGEAPVAILINEAKGWKANGNSMLHMAVNALADKLRRPYVGEIGCGIRGDATTPALIYDPQVLRLDYWGNSTATNNDQQNVAKMHVRGQSAAKFRAVIKHLHPNDGALRVSEAHETKAFISGMPTLLAGDLNNSASGPHTDMDWTRAPELLRMSKAILLPDGTYKADTLAMDLMLGDWDPATMRRTGRVEALGRRAIGWHALAEIAYQQGMPAAEAFQPTVNRSAQEGGGLLIDWMLVNNAWAEGLVPGTYHVHVPGGTDPSMHPSDHRLVTATLEI